jgi:hypothetical protein
MCARRDSAFGGTGPPWGGNAYDEGGVIGRRLRWALRARQGQPSNPREHPRQNALNICSVERVRGAEVDGARPAHCWRST